MIKTRVQGASTPAHLSRPGILLVVLLVFGVLGAGVLVYHVWRGQYDAVLTSLLRERQQATVALASRLESALQAHLAQGARYLLEGDLGSAAPRIAALKRRFPDLEQVLRFDADGGMIYCVPGPNAQPEQYRRWLAERLAHALSDRPAGDISIGGFLEHVDGNQVLFAFAPIPKDLTDGASGWLVMRHGVAPLLASVWTPLQLQFAEQHGGTVELAQALPKLGDHDVAIPASAFLAGWTLHYRPDTERLTAVARGQSQLLGVLLLALGALPVTALGAWWWYGRRRLELAQAKDDFVAHVSHELKTPLAVIRVHAETLALGRIGEETKRRAYLETIVREAERLTAMIEQVLDFSRMRQNGFHFRMDASDLAATVSHMVETQRPHLEMEGFTLSCRLASDLPSLRHDTEGISRILANLLDNAAKYSFPGGTIEIVLERREDGVALAVADRGRGLAADETQHLTEPFVRGTNCQAEGIKGVGLGLAVVARSVQAHDASFHLAPRDGGGTLAQVLFPFGRPAT